MALQGPCETEGSGEVPVSVEGPSGSGAGGLELRTIFRFWLPLAATWVMMAVEGPFVAALVARLPEPRFNLAAFGVALALAFVAEAPIIMLLAATTALARDRESFRRLRRFSILMNGGVTGAMALIAFPPVFEVLASRVLALPPAVADRAQLAVLVFLPWPAAIGFRRFQQGILIAAGRTRLVAYGTAVRLSTMAATGLVLFLYGGLDGAVVGAGALSAGVVVEAAASWVWARGDRRRLELKPPVSPGEVPTLADIQRFYWPLAVTPLMNMVAMPLVTFFTGRGHLPIESLRRPSGRQLVRLPLSVSGATAFQEVVIAPDAAATPRLRSLRRFGDHPGRAVVAGDGGRCPDRPPPGSGLQRSRSTASWSPGEHAVSGPGPYSCGCDRPRLDARMCSVLLRTTRARHASGRSLSWPSSPPLCSRASRSAALPAAIVATTAILAGRSAGALFLAAACQGRYPDDNRPMRRRGFPRLVRCRRWHRNASRLVRRSNEEEP